MTAQQSQLPERIRVILADDARHLLELEKSFFAEHEFAVHLAQNGCEAYSLVMVIRPAIVFLNLLMPALGGEECCRLIKSDPRLRDTRVVLVANDDERQIQRCRDAQPDLVIVKPVRRREFLGAVHTLVGQLSRVPARWPVRIAAELYDGACQHEVVLWTINLSEGGVFLATDGELPAGCPYTLTLKFAAGRSFTVPVRIAWVNHRVAPRSPALPPGVGLQFLGLADESRNALRTFLCGTSGEDCLPDSSASGDSMFVELPILAGVKPGKPCD